LRFSRTNDVVERIGEHIVILAVHVDDCLSPCKPPLKIDRNLDNDNLSLSQLPNIEWIVTRLF